MHKAEAQQFFYDAQFYFFARAREKLQQGNLCVQ
jgi:hypothetical protein